MGILPALDFEFMTFDWSDQTSTMNLHKYGFDCITSLHKAFLAFFWHNKKILKYFIIINHWAITCSNVDPDLCRHMASLGHNDH